MIVYQAIINNPLGAAFFVFIILGFTYYMVATILMRGSIFVSLRGWVMNRARSGNWFFNKVHEMLGCLMCTATEAAIWTLGLAIFIIGIQYDVVRQILSTISARNAVLSLPVEIFLTAMLAFAISLAVGGEAWVIKTVAEHRERRFLELRKEFREKEIDFQKQIANLESGRSNAAEYIFDMEDGQ